MQRTTMTAPQSLKALDIRQGDAYGTPIRLGLLPRQITKNRRVTLSAYMA